MTTTTGSISGARVAALPPSSRRYREGRRCSYPGCITRISVYNRRDTCYIHAGVRFPRLRGRKPAR